VLVGICNALLDGDTLVKAHRKIAFVLGILPRPAFTTNGSAMPDMRYLVASL
jgi:hypothetical protein